MYYKTYERRTGLVLAVCDREICGKKLKGEKNEFFVNPRFYKGEEGDEAGIISLLQQAININLVGKRAVQCGIKAGIVDPTKIVRIQGVPHAQVVVMTI